MKTKGLVAAPPTAFRADSSIDLGVVAPLAEHLRRQGVVGVFVNGTTGEGMSLCTEEREELAAEWRRVLPSGMRLFVHVGHNSVAECKRLSQHAQAIGADAIAVMAPGFFKPAGIDGLVDWCAPIAAAAPELPFYFYHMPSMNGVNVSIADFLPRAADRIPSLAGIKFTFEAMGDYMSALRVAGGRFDVLWGRDEMLLGALAMGAEGGVGSTYNAIAPIYLKLIEAFNRGDWESARDLQAQAIAFIDSLVATGNFFAGLKASLRAQGVPITPAVRLPLASVSEQKLARIKLP
ncbi:MAG: dihydrodipicolinate synthase family protein [bacterium]